MSKVSDVLKTELEELIDDYGFDQVQDALDKLAKEYVDSDESEVNTEEDDESTLFPDA